ncbi:hypothetical protein L5M43_19425 [Shewanella sp. SW36]|uniref:hypothetical protein n=1 Tax=Shewanella TaxID=22 RepID=UPI0021DAD9A9|nr:MULTISPECIES: hypothetical protein [unclassified Shewanella]MCU7977392.1 hypothetical protein [Shewanella sp. SW36]MCU7992649.1 hypothetical protein [Shewanella sp. SW1]MCU7997229.1 hypothetical protein [Shewanella sp. SM95]MCU8002291.1 hypothetical protein [Shewanella sp. SM96]MCU8042704.1 hypothetical protein [Shewanella sp. SM68]
MEFLIKPHDGIGPIKLGMSRKQVKVLFAAFFTLSDGASDFYFDSCLQIEFENDLVDFIGVSQNDNYQLMFGGIDAFDVEGITLFNAISANESESHSFNESEYIFPEQIVTLWDMDEQYDNLGDHKRKVWAQVGIGTKSYLKVANGL